MDALPLPIAILLSGAALLVLVGIIAAIVEQCRDRGPMTCIRCGCTDDNACPGGCWWTSFRPPICSRCPD